VSAKKKYTRADCEIKSYALSEERVSPRGKQAALIRGYGHVRLPDSCRSSPATWGSKVLIGLPMISSVYRDDVISPLRTCMHCREMPKSCSYRRMRRASVSVTSDTAVPFEPARAVRPTLCR
jgi:hypothetical protein